MIEQLKHIFYKTINLPRQKSGPELPAAILNQYNASREKLNTDYICHAPFSNMYFNIHGDCAPCWLTFINPDSYLDKSIREIWFGDKYQSLRRHLINNDLTYKCNVCLKNLQGGNYTSVLAKAYDINPVQEYPSMMELEIANTCNLECVMCIGELSSAIRKNRDKLPAIKSPYDDAFVDQLEEFIPHLKELRFNGGEPFLIGSVFKIFEKVERLNPKLKIVIATNGTVVNYKVKEWLNRLNIHINFSLDSLTPDIYETIRVNAHFDRVMEHFEFFHQYTKANNRTMCLMVNPMRNNWHEMPEFIRFVNKHNINIWFNTIQRPVEWSIWALPYLELSALHDKLSSVEFTREEKSGPLSAYNIAIYKNLVNVQIKNWVTEAKERDERITIPGQVLSEADAKDIFTKKMSDHIHFKYNDVDDQAQNQLELLFKKIEETVKVLEERNIAEGFYKTLSEAPADVIYEQFEKYSINSLAENFEKHNQQQPV